MVNDQTQNKVHRWNKTIVSNREYSKTKHSATHCTTHLEIPYAFRYYKKYKMYSETNFFSFDGLSKERI